MNPDHFHPDSGPGGRAPLGHVFAYVEGRDVKDAFLRHALQIGIGDVVAVFNRIHSRLHRVVDAVKGDGMRGYLVVLAMRLIDNRPQFVHGEGRNIVEHAVRPQEVTTVGINFHPVGAKADLFTHGFACLVRTIYYLHAMRNLDFPRVAQQRISSGYVQGARSHLHPGAGDDAVIHGPFQVHVGVAGAFGL